MIPSDTIYHKLFEYRKKKWEEPGSIKTFGPGNPDRFEVAKMDVPGLGEVDVLRHKVSGWWKYISEGPVSFTVYDSRIQDIQQMKKRDMVQIFDVWMNMLDGK